MPSGRNARRSIPGVPLFVALLLDVLNFISRFYAWLYGVTYESVLDKSDGTLLTKIASWAEEGKLRPVVGKVILFEEQALRDACTGIASQKGGFGKVVVKIL
jgi:NADPH:quinone reductase-like Zn-dependent oxidoreductase